MNINEHVGGKKKDNFWDISTAIAQMYQLCCVCVQIKWFTVNRNAPKRGDNYRDSPPGATCKLSKKRRMSQLSSGTGTPVLMDCQSQPTHVSFLNQKGRRSGSDVLVKMPPRFSSPLIRVNDTLSGHISGSVWSWSRILNFDGFPHSLVPLLTLQKTVQGSFDMCTHLIATRKWLINAGPKCWHRADKASPPKMLHIHFGNFCYLWSTTKGDMCVSRVASKRVRGKWEQSSGAVVQQRWGGGKTGWMYCGVTAARRRWWLSLHITWQPAKCFPQRHVL